MLQHVYGNRVLLTTSEAMHISGLSREHIQRLLREQHLEGVKLGHDWFVFEDALKIYVAQPRKTGPKGPRKKPDQNGSHTPETNHKEDLNKTNK